MKKILFFSTLALLAAACHKEPYPQDADAEYLVYTEPAKNVNFADFQTFDIADSLLVIGQSDKPQYSTPPQPSQRNSMAKSTVL